jgi:hypothetical protein
MTLDTHATDTMPDPPLFGPERQLQNEVRNLMSLVGELTVMLVVQGAHLAAARAGRKQPIGEDVDESISVVADNVPDDVALTLWETREKLIERFVRGPTAA